MKAWFVAQDAGPEFAVVPLDARLVDADPLVEEGLYDRASDLFWRFYGQRSGIASGKASKALHFKRPHLFPILDTRLRYRYRSVAHEAARRLRREAPARFDDTRVAYWAAIRDDLLQPVNPRGIEILRGELAAVDNPVHHQVANKLSDVRILDMVTWALGNR